MEHADTNTTSMNTHMNVCGKRRNLVSNIHPPAFSRNVQMRAAQGPRARGGMADARARPCWGVAGAYRSKQRSNLRLGRSVGRQSRP